MTQSIQEALLLDVLTRTTCNGKYTEEFKLHLEKINSDILLETNELLIKLGTYYQKEILEIIIHVDRIGYFYFNDNKYTGIEEIVSGMDLFENEMFNEGMIEYGTIKTRNEPKEEFYQIIKNELDLLKSNLSELLFDSKLEVKPIRKLKWNVKPAVLGSLLCELEKKRWIELPKEKGNVSYKAFANQCDSIFEFQGVVSSLERVLNRNTKPWSGANMFNFEYVENIS
jgi:hypothetical protein